LVSFVLVSKFADHLSLYMLEDILFRHGVSMSRGRNGSGVALLRRAGIEGREARHLEKPVTSAGKRATQRRGRGRHLPLLGPFA
jgi:hypothetical protein